MAAGISTLRPGTEFDGVSRLGALLTWHIPDLKEQMILHLGHRNVSKYTHLVQLLQFVDIEECWGKRAVIALQLHRMHDLHGIRRVHRLKFIINDFALRESTVSELGRGEDRTGQDRKKEWTYELPAEFVAKCRRVHMP